MQFLRVIKGFCPSLAGVVETDNTYESVLIAIKEFFIFPKRLPYTPTVVDKSSMLLLIVGQLLFLFYFHL